MTVLFVSVLLVSIFASFLLFVCVCSDDVQVNYLIADGKSHWLEGVLLMTLYLIIAIAAW